MNIFKTPDKNTSKFFELCGIKKDDILAFCRGDMNTDCEYREYRLVLTAKSLFILDFPFKAETVDYSFGAAEPPCPEIFSDETMSVSEYPISKLKNAGVAELVSGGSFFINFEDEDRRICTLSSGLCEGARRFASAIDAVIDGKPVDEKLFKTKDVSLFCDKCGSPYIDPERKICPKCMNKKSVFMRTLSYFTRYKFALAVIMLTFVGNSILDIALPYVSGTVYFDEVLGKSPNLFKGAWTLSGEDSIIFLAIVLLTYLALRIISAVVAMVRDILVARTVPKAVKSIKYDVFNSMRNLSLRFFTDRQTGGLLTRVLYDSNEVSGFFTNALPYTLGHAICFVLTVVAMYFINWQLATFSLIIMPVMAVISFKLRPRLWRLYGRRFRASRSMSSTLNDSITGARVVKAFGKEDSAVELFSKSNKKMRSTEIEVAKYENIFSLLFSGTLNVMSVGVWIIGTFLILGTTGTAISYGVLATFIAYVGQLARPINFLSEFFRSFTSSMNAAQRIFEIIDARPDITEKKDAVNPKEIKGKVELKNVCFSYIKGRQILKDVSIEIDAGQMLGVVGRSGVGKTTMVNLISRLYDVDSGQILIDDIDIRDLSFDSMKNNVAMVSQDSYVFMGTVADNIAYARPQSTREEIIDAARAAGAHDFICKMPDGYDTLVGSGGRGLSGGERQRISIARAILADPKILILDEATSAVDTATERHIQAALDELIKGRTTISIAHRISTLNNADKMVVLDNGKVTETGTHDQLMELKGTYYRLVELQSKALSLES